MNATDIMDNENPYSGKWQYRELYGKRVMIGNAPPVIFATGLDEPLSRQRATQFGATAFLVKPFPGHELVLAVENALRTSAV